MQRIDKRYQVRCDIIIGCLALLTGLTVLPARGSAASPAEKAPGAMRAQVPPDAQRAFARDKLQRKPQPGMAAGSCARKLLPFSRFFVVTCRAARPAGSGYLPPHQADTGRMDAGKAYALRKGMAIMDRGI